MSVEDNDLKSLWQTGQSGVDIDELLRHVAAERRRMTQFLWFEIVGAVVSTGLIVYYDRIGLFGENRYVMWLLLGAALALQAWMWLWRRGLWRAVSEAPIDLLQLQLRRARVGLCIARWYAYGTPASLLVGMVLGRFFVSGTSRLAIDDTTRAIILCGLLAFVAALTGFGVIMMRRYRARIEWIRSRIAELTEAAD